MGFAMGNEVWSRAWEDLLCLPHWFVTYRVHVLGDEGEGAGVCVEGGKMSHMVISFLFVYLHLHLHLYLDWVL